MSFRNRSKELFLFGALTIGLSTMALLGGCGNHTGANDTNINSQIWGQVDAQSVDILTKIPGYVDTMYVKEGQMVKKGEILAHIDSKDLVAKQAQVEAQASAARAKVAQAQAAMELAAKDLDRLKTLYEQGAISQQMYDGVRTKYNVAVQTYHEAQAGVAAYEQGVEQVAVNVQSTDLKAPIDGVIATKYVNTGSLVSTGMPIYNVQSTNDNWINFRVPETILNSFKLGQKVQVQGRNSHVKLEGTIVDISHKPDFATQRATSERGNAGDIISFNVKVQVNDPHIYPGMRFRLLGYSMTGDK